MRVCRPALATVALLIGSLADGGAQQVWRLDFGTGSSPVADGYVRVTKDTAYAKALGYGWAPVPAEHHQIKGKAAAKPGKIPGLFDRDRETGSALARDLVMAMKPYHPFVAHTFCVDVPSGEYEVAVLSGDALYRVGAYTVAAEGGKPQAVGEQAVGQFKAIVLRASVTDGQLSLAFDTEKYWTVNAILVYPRAEAAAMRKQEARLFKPAAASEEAMAKQAELAKLSLDELRKRARPYLEDICQAIVKQDVGSGTLKGVRDTRDSIFINGNYARVLIGGYRVTKNRRYLDEALRWCDSLVAQQVHVVTAKGSPGGWWSDIGPNRNIYLADTGTATSPLALALGYAKGERRTRYLDALTRYVAFMREGMKADPQNRGRKPSPGWIVQTGKDAGALGCGYYRGHLSTAPYCISTATTGCLMLSQLYAATKDDAYRRIAVGCARWLLGTIAKGGSIPYIIDGQRPQHLKWGTVTYVCEGLLAAHLLVADAKLRAEIEAGLKPVVEFALRRQDTSGIWGKARSGDGQRSGLVPQLLWWYHNKVEKRDDIVQALRRNYAYVLVPQLSRRYGVKELVRPTGFVGLAAADFIEPGVTLRFEAE